ncbi:restriction endonuclease subunit S [Psychrobacter sp. Pi2-51]|uniref:restriction endonuclease subunit S n=1 Tax=Psychrobacter sp. Pi2-51 TaxID=2774132 RepID=UPI001918CD2E|nr:restriction endonuclease subunit S [Psychrobacter sp. Pi2-51]
MASDWVKTTLGEIVKLGNGIIQTGPFGSQLHASDYVDEGIPVIMPLNIINNKIDLSGIARITKEDAERLSKHLVKKNDIVYSRRGDVTRKALITELEEGMFCGTGCLLVRPGNSIDARFLTYHLSSPINQEWIIRHAVGATMPNLNTGILKRVPLNIPSLDTQKAIAHILGSLDDKIELNRQMNETLEAMAQALFKSWFVDFDPVIDNALAAGNAIPDEFIERAEQRKGIEKKDNSDIQALFPDEFEFTEEMGWIPKGWKVTPLASLIKLTGGGTPKTSIPEYWNGNIPWFSVVDAPSSSDVFVLDTEKYVTSLGVENSSTKILSVGTTIISARGTVGKCAMVSRPMAMNQSCYGVSGNEGISNTFVYYSVFLSVSELQSKGHGSVFNTITGDTFKSINVAFGGGRLTRKFDDLVNPYFEKILGNSLQAKTLSKLRDTLLPKLMSGELRISDAAELVDKAV